MSFKSTGLTDEKAKKDLEDQDDTQVKPTKGLSAYNMFCRERCLKVRDERGVNAVEALKLVAAEWATLTENQKVPYVTLSKEDDLR